MGYGRANLDLLWRRVLGRPRAANVSHKIHGRIRPTTPCERLEPMVESWVFADGTAALPADAAKLREQIAAGRLESWLTSSTGRSLGIISNTERAMFLLFDGGDDPGEHAVDPGAIGQSGGYILANGQHDEYSG
jgi:hypothetical protein